MNIEIREIKEDETWQWDDIVKNSPYGTIFHTLKWLKIVEKHTKNKLYPLIGFKGKEIIGIFPVFYQKRGPLRMIFSPPPKVAIPYLGQIYIGYNQWKQNKRESISIEFQAQIDRFIFNKTKANYISVVTSPRLIDSRPFKWNGYQVKPLYNYAIDLNNSISTVWSGFKKTLRKNIKKAEEIGVIIKEGTHDDLNFMYDSLVERYKEQKEALNISKDFLFDIYDAFAPQNINLFLAEFNGEKIGGIIFTCYKEKVSIWMGAVRSDMQGLYPNDLLQWKIIQWAKENNFMFCEILGGDNQMISYFKSRYNPDLVINFGVEKSTLFTKIVKTSYLKILRPIKGWIQAYVKE